MRFLTAIVAVCGIGCADDADAPLTGATHRYALDGIVLPMTNAEAHALGTDLDGDGTVDNQLGAVISSLAGEGDVTSHSFDMIAGGSLPSAIEIITDDLENDSSVGLNYLGTPGASSAVLRGRFIDGWFRPDDLASTSLLGAAQLLLPVFTEADPSPVNVFALQVTLAPDGGGGFNADVFAAVPVEPALLESVALGATQMIHSEPSDHRTFAALFDTNGDGVISADEVATNSLFVSLLSPDITIRGHHALSLGFHAHFRACESGQCLDDVPFDRCFDRQLDGDETDIDCGGSCRKCEAGATCVSGSDCETTTCDQGHCGPPSCTNGSRDGLETDVDCGGGCAGCAIGQRCYGSDDCASGQCGKPCMETCFLCCLGNIGGSDTCYPPP